MEVALQDVVFFKHHGFLAEEALTGGTFKVNVVASYEPVNIPVIHLGETIDYTDLLAIVKQRMEHKTSLLETLVTQIALDILEKHPIVEHVKVSINKTNAPIENFQGAVGVSYELKRSNP